MVPPRGRRQRRRPFLTGAARVEWELRGCWAPGLKSGPAEARKWELTRSPPRGRALPRACLRQAGDGIVGRYRLRCHPHCAPPAPTTEGCTSAHPSSRRVVLPESLRRRDPKAANEWIEGVIAHVEKTTTIPLAGRIVPELGRSDQHETFLGRYRVV